MTGVSSNSAKTCCRLTLKATASMRQSSGPLTKGGIVMHKWVPFITMVRLVEPIPMAPGYLGFMAVQSQSSQPSSIHTQIRSSQKDMAPSMVVRYRIIFLIQRRVLATIYCLMQTFFSSGLEKRVRSSTARTVTIYTGLVRIMCSTFHKILG